MVQQKMKKFSCGNCKEDCKTRRVHCEVCNTWFHAVCQKIGIGDLKKWSSLKDSYICRSCCCFSDGTGFDYLLGLSRLQEAAKRGRQHLQDAVQREALLLEDRYVNKTCSDSIPFDEDSVAQHYLDRYHFKSGTTLRTTGDGDCLFNAASIILCGDESMGTELKYKCCIEMVLNGKEIQNHRDRAAIVLLSPDYEDAVLTCVRSGGYSCVWTIIALSNVTKHNIETLYPLINGPKDLAARTMNTMITPSSGLTEDKPMKIMWTHTLSKTPSAKKSWTPNHFVPLIHDPKILHKGKSAKTSTPADKAASVIFIPKQPTQGDRPWRTQRKRSKPLSPIRTVESDIHCFNRFENLSDSEDSNDPDFQCSSTCSSTDSDSGSAGQQQPSKRRKTNKNKRTKPQCPPRSVGEELMDTSFQDEPDICLPSPRQSHHDTFVQKDTSLSCASNSGEDSTRVEPKFSKITSSMMPLPNPGRFLSPEEQLEILRSTENVAKRVPPGNKSNSYVIVDDSVNKEKRSNNIRSDFVDDCGVWDSSTGNTVNIHFMITDEKHCRLRTIFLKDGIFCTEKRSKYGNKTTQLWNPIHPQPTEQNLVKIHRYYTKQKGNHTFKKRVTTFEKLPSKFESKTNFAFIEYCGQQEKISRPHGNSQDKDEHYTRTDPLILHQANQLTKDKKPTEIMNMMGEDNSFMAPKNSKQIRNKKYRETVKEEPLKPTNVADEVYQVLCSLQTSDFIQQLVFTKKKRPIILLYSDNQIKDLRANCLGKHGSVIGIDRTFNLGSCYVTAMTFKHQAVVQRETKGKPIMLGPIMLHYESDFEAYTTFLQHIHQKIGDNSVILGSDEEKALTKAIHHVFPAVTHLLCTKHMKDNIRRNLQDKIGCSKEDREKIVKEIFGPQGIVKNCDDSTSPETTFYKLKPYFQKYPSFQTYFDKHLHDNLINHVIRPINDGIIHELWTNNNTESINNRMKMECDWKAKKLPALIECLEKITNSQMQNLRRSLYGYGNFKLTTQFSKFRLSESTWAVKSTREKQVIFNKFLTTKKVNISEELESSKFDSKFTIPKTKTLAKKPNQRSRPRAERTRSFFKLKKFKRKSACSTDED